MSRSDRRSDWGLADAALLWALQIVATAIVASLLVAALFDGDVPDPRPIGYLLAAQSAGWLVYLLGPVAVSGRRGGGVRDDLRLGVTAADVAGGTVLGVLLQLVAVPVIYWPIQQLVDDDPSDTARDLVATVDGPLEIAGLTALVAIGAPIVEEFFYRGFVLAGAERTLARRTTLSSRSIAVAAVIVSSVVFALVHIDPLLYPGTFLLGVVAGTAVIRTGRLGPAWGLHLGFNLTTLVVLLAERG